MAQTIADFKILVSAQTKNAGKGLGKFTSTLKSFAGGVTLATGVAVAGFTALPLAVLGASKAFVKAQAHFQETWNLIDDNTKAARALGIEYGRLSGFIVASGLAGGDRKGAIDALEKMNFRLKNFAATGSGEAKEAVKALGLQMEDLQGLDVVGQMQLIGKEIQRFDRPTQLWIARMIAGKKNAATMVNLWASGNDALTKTLDITSSLTNLSERQLGSVEANNDAWLLFQTRLEAVKQNLAANIAPLFHGITVALTEWFDIMTGVSGGVEKQVSTWELIQEAVFSVVDVIKRDLPAAILASQAHISDFFATIQREHARFTRAIADAAEFAGFGEQAQVLNNIADGMAFASKTARTAAKSQRALSAEFAALEDTSKTVNAAIEANIAASQHASEQATTGGNNFFGNLFKGNAAAKTAAEFERIAEAMKAEGAEGSPAKTFGPVTSRQVSAASIGKTATAALRGTAEARNLQRRIREGKILEQNLRANVAAARNTEAIARNTEIRDAGGLFLYLLGN